MMKGPVLSLVGAILLAIGTIAMAQMGGGEMMEREGHGYGMMGGTMAGWIIYGLIKAAVVVIALWFLHRIAKAVEKIAASKG